MEKLIKNERFLEKAEKSAYNGYHPESGSVIAVKEKIVRYSESLEDYLEMIHILGGENVRSVDVATRMNVTKASVNRAVNTLMEKSLLEKAPYGEITLTPTGKATADAVLRKHKVLRKFLIEILGVSETVANEEACGIEHNISDDTLKRWENLVETYHP